MTTQADKTKDVEVIETREAPVENVPHPVATMDKPVTETSLVETSVPEVTPATEVAVTEILSLLSLSLLKLLKTRQQNQRLILPLRPLQVRIVVFQI